ncbi:UNVERIFIED_ORG: hypothetical protein J2X74_005640 [Bacillus sp. 1751]|nr:hypothetical protein [Bacillus sp. 1751]
MGFGSGMIIVPLLIALIIWALFKVKNWWATRNNN